MKIIFCICPSVNPGEEEEKPVACSLNSIRLGKPASGADAAAAAACLPARPPACLMPSFLQLKKVSLICAINWQRESFV
jgi:hypothetical protein